MTLIGDNHLSVKMVLEVVVPDIVPGQLHNQAQMEDSLHTYDCPQVLVGLQLSPQVPVASVTSSVQPLSPDPVSSWLDSILAFDEMITVVEPFLLGNLKGLEKIAEPKLF
jgi:hypothetical protein